MKFILTYDGLLPSSGNKPKNGDKWRIRKELHPQLEDLWSSHPALQWTEQTRWWPKTGGAMLFQSHHMHRKPEPPFQPSPLDRDAMDLCGPIEKYGAWFRPLVRDSYALHCGLKITFLRQEPPGKVYQGGDIDGRMKTLLDALSMPHHQEQIIESGGDASTPIHCLLEDDALISGFQIESERLLTGEERPKDYVRLNIEVDVRVRQTTIYNQSFLG